MRGVLRLQSPSECTEDTEGGRSPEDRPGAGDLALRLLGLAAIFGFPPPPAKRGTRSSPGSLGRDSGARGGGAGSQRFPFRSFAKMGSWQEKSSPRAEGSTAGMAMG